MEDAQKVSQAVDRNGNPLAFASKRQRQVVEEIIQDGSMYAEPPLENGTIEIRSGGHHVGFVLADGRYV
jgi:hypothetical protein